jgi:hypothetical protein
MARRALTCAVFLTFLLGVGCGSTRTQSATQSVAEQFAPVVQESKRVVQSSDSFFGTKDANR